MWTMSIIFLLSWLSFCGSSQDTPSSEGNLADTASNQSSTANHAAKYRVSATLSVVFTKISEKTTITSKPIKVIGYGMGRAHERTIAERSARASADVSLASQIGGTEFSFAKSEGVTLLQMKTSQELKGVIDMGASYIKIPEGGWEVYLTEGTDEMEVPMVEGTDVVSIEQTIQTNDVGEALDIMKADAINKAIQQSLPNEESLSGVIYLSNFRVELSQGSEESL